jgi:hypothetical protein
LEKYSEQTIEAVIKFLDVVESLPLPNNQKKAKASGIPSSSMQQNVNQQSPQTIVRQTLKQNLMILSDEEELPNFEPIFCRVSNGHVDGVAEIENILHDPTLLSDWFMEQSKKIRHAKKLDPDVCCPYNNSVLSCDARQQPIKPKRRKRTARTKKKAAIEIDEEEEIEDIEERGEEEEEENEDEEEEEEEDEFDEDLRYARAAMQFLDMEAEEIEEHELVGYNEGDEYDDNDSVDMENNEDEENEDEEDDEYQDEDIMEVEEGEEGEGEGQTINHSSDAGEDE